MIHLTYHAARGLFWFLAVLISASALCVGLGGLFALLLVCLS